MISSLKIGAHNYRVIFPYTFTERSDLSGQCDSAMNEIRITELDSGGNARAASNIQATLLHEVIHAVDNASGLSRLSSSEREKEELVEMLAQGLLQVFTDNPGFLMEFMKEK